MNDLSLSEVDFYIVFFVVGSIGILVLVLWFTILDFQCRRNQRMQIMSITSLGHERSSQRQRANTEVTERTSGDFVQSHNLSVDNGVLNAERRN